MLYTNCIVGWQHGSRLIFPVATHAAKTPINLVLPYSKQLHIGVSMSDVLQNGFDWPYDHMEG